jgi:hypothetical protein
MTPCEQILEASWRITSQSKRWECVLLVTINSRPAQAASLPACGAWGRTTPCALTSLCGVAAPKRSLDEAAQASRRVHIDDRRRQ